MACDLDARRGVMYLANPNKVDSVAFVLKNMI
jgi:hypothetical protein